MVEAQLQQDAISDLAWWRTDTNADVRLIRLEIIEVPKLTVEQT